MTTLAVAVALLIGVDPSGADPDQGPGDPGELQGVWAVKSWVEDGKPVAHEGVGDGGFRFRWYISLSDGRFSSLPGADTGPELAHLREYDQGFRFHPRPERFPRQLDIRFSDEAEPCLRGIYTLEGGTLTICLGEKDRPKAFESRPGSGFILYVCERAKPRHSPIHQPKE